MKTIEEVQRFKQDKCALLLQTAECCDLNEIIEQLKTQSTKTKANGISKTVDVAKNVLIKKFNHNYASIETLNNVLNNNNNNSNQIKPVSQESYMKSIGAGYKMFPKFVQNIDTIGFEKPNWKPLLLNEKADNQFNNVSITNSLASFSSGQYRFSNPRSKISKNIQREHHKLDSILNSNSHKQKLIEMNRKKFQQTTLTDSMESFISASSIEFSDRVAQQQQQQLKQVKSKKQLLLGDSKFALKFRRKDQNSRESSNEGTKNMNSDANSLASDEKVFNFPTIRKRSDQTDRMNIEDYYPNEGIGSFFVSSKTNNSSKLSFYDSELIRENNLHDIITISKISPLNKNRFATSTECGSQLESYNKMFQPESSVVKLDIEENNKNIQKNEVNEKIDEIPVETIDKETHFLNSIIQKKNELDAYVTQVKLNNESTFINQAPPNSPIPYETNNHKLTSVTDTKSTSSSSRRSPSPPPPSLKANEVNDKEVRHVIVRIPDPKKFPQTLMSSQPVTASLAARRRKALTLVPSEKTLPQQVIEEHHQIKPLIKNSNSREGLQRNTKTLEKNLQKKIGENSVNMIKINKNVRVISNVSRTSVSSNSTSASYGIGASKLPTVNDKLRVDIYVPSGVN